eukprot:RCo052807
MSFRSDHFSFLSHSGWSGLYGCVYVGDLSSASRQRAGSPPGRVDFYLSFFVCVMFLFLKGSGLVGLWKNVGFGAGFLGNGEPAQALKKSVCSVLFFLRPRTDTAFACHLTSSMTCAPLFKKK